MRARIILSIWATMIVVAVAGSVVAGCGSDRPPIECTEHSNCDLSEGGLCLLSTTGSGSHWCAYPDDTCGSGMRWSSLDTGDALSGSCVAPGHPGDAGDGADGDVDVDAAVIDAGDVPPIDAGPTNGVEAFVRSWGSGGTDKAYAVAVDGDQAITVGGSFEGMINFGTGSVTSVGASDGFVVHVAKDGTVQWILRLGHEGIDQVVAVAAGPNGQIAVAGTFTGEIDVGGEALTSAGSSDVFLAVYDSTGQHVWSRRVGGTLNDGVSGIAINNLGQVAAIGRFSGTADFGGTPSSSNGGTQDVWIAGYEPDGAFGWSRRLGGPENDSAGGVASFGADFYVLGRFKTSMQIGTVTYTSAGDYDVFVAKVVDGTFAWSRRIGGAGTESGYGIAARSDGPVLVAGFTSSMLSLGGPDIQNLGSNDILVAHLAEASGAHLWSHGYGGAAIDIGLGIAVTPAGDVAITGSIEGTVNLGGGPMPPFGEWDLFVLRLVGATGNYADAARYGSTYREQGAGIAASAEPFLVVVGDSSGNTATPLGTLTNQGNTDAFVLQID
jgi:hypothetical protein